MTDKILELETFATTDTVANAVTVIQSLIEAVKAMYPVGSVIATTTDTNPGDYLGGTWTAYAQGRFMIGASDAYEGGTEGGSASHHHMTCVGFDKNAIYLRYKVEGTDERAPYYGSTVQGDNIMAVSSSEGSYSLNRTAYTESTSALPPYIATYLWERTA